MRTHIREATRDDLLAIQKLNCEVQALHHEHFPELFKPASEATFPDRELAKLLADPTQIILIAEIDTEAVGYALLIIHTRPESWNRKAARFLQINHIAVTHAVRRNGVGRALVQAAEDQAQRLALNGIALDFWTFNKDAEAFYQELGFSERTSENLKGKP